MINPVIFSFNIGSFTLALRWYGVLVMTGAVAAAWFAEREVTRRGEKGRLFGMRSFGSSLPASLAHACGM